MTNLPIIQYINPSYNQGIACLADKDTIVNAERTCSVPSFWYSTSLPVNTICSIIKRHLLRYPLSCLSNPNGCKSLILEKGLPKPHILFFICCESFDKPIKSFIFLI